MYVIEDADTSRTEVSDHSFVQEPSRRTSHENMPGPELTEDQVDTLVDREELQKLLKEQMRLTKSARGEKGGVLLKAEPPSLDDSEDYGVWKKRLQVWRSATGMSDK